MNSSELINRELHRVLLDSSAIWLNMLDNEAKVTIWNKAAEEISGYSKQEVLGKDNVWELLYPEEEYRTYILNEALQVIKQHKVLTDFETTIINKKGVPRTLLWNTHNVLNNLGDPIGSIALARDITDIKSNEQKLKSLTKALEKSNEQLRELSYMDPLTNIPNRRAYQERLEQEIKSCSRTEKPLSCLMIDIDFFKKYNDTYGHKKGDEALRKVAMQIKESLPRETDFISRYGGEEFAAFLPYTSIGNAKTVAEKILNAINKLNIEHKHSPFNHSLTVSIGIASTTTGDYDLIENADRALYEAKKEGRNRINFYKK